MGSGFTEAERETACTKVNIPNEANDSGIRIDDGGTQTVVRTLAT